MSILRYAFVSLLIAAFNLASSGVSRAVTIDIPEKKLIDAMNANIGYVLANKPSPLMRDGALACAALLKMGINEPAKEWLDTQTEGKVLAEGGGKGEYVFVLRNYIDYSGDKGYLKTAYPKAVKILGSLRGLRRGCFYDLFALRSLKDGAYLADLMGDKANAGWMKREAEDLRKSIYGSMKEDLDPDTAAIAVAVAEELEYAPKDLIRNTFDVYFADFAAGMISAEGRRPGPYEVYSAGAYFRMDQRERGLTVLRYFMENPAGREGRGYTVQTAPGYIDALRTAFVYEDAGKLILGEGLAPEWFVRGIEVKDMPTPYGKICYVIKKEGDVIRYFIYGSARPPKGVKFVLPEEFSGCKIEEMKTQQHK